MQSFAKSFLTLNWESLRAWWDSESIYFTTLAGVNIREQGRLVLRRVALRRGRFVNVSHATSIKDLRHQTHILESEKIKRDLTRLTTPPAFHIVPREGRSNERFIEDNYHADSMLNRPSFTLCRDSSRRRSPINTWGSQLWTATFRPSEVDSPRRALSTGCILPISIHVSSARPTSNGSRWKVTFLQRSWHHICHRGSSWLFLEANRIEKVVCHNIASQDWKSYWPSEARKPRRGERRSEIQRPIGAIALPWCLHIWPQSPNYNIQIRV